MHDKYFANTGLDVRRNSMKLSLAYVCDSITNFGLLTKELKINQIGINSLWSDGKIHL